MESLSYNDVPLQILVGKVEYDPVKSEDGTGNLFVKWRIRADCVFNPAATSFDEFGFPAAGNLPGATSIGIQELLQTPYKRLVVVAGGSTILDVDGDTDCQNGPQPGPVTVKQMIGLKTWLVHFEIEAFVPYETVSDPPEELAIVSNRWSAHLSVDPDTWLSKRTIDGLVRFRTDLLGEFAINADDLRVQFAAHGIPTNFRRDAIDVQALSDGATVRYRVVDEEQYVTLGGGSLALKVQGSYSGWFTRGSTARAGGQTFIETFRNMLSPWRWNPIGTTMEAIQLPQRYASNVISNLPRWNLHCKAMVWGHRKASKTDLLGMALAICFNRVGGLSALSIASSEVSVMQLIHENYVEAEVSHSVGADTAVTFSGSTVPIPGANPNLATFDGGTLAYWKACLGLSPEIIDPVFGNIVTNIDDINPLPPKFGTAGSYLESLVTQILWAPGATVPAPP